MCRILLIFIGFVGISSGLVKHPFHVFQARSPEMLVPYVGEPVVFRAKDLLRGPVSAYNTMTGALRATCAGRYAILFYSHGHCKHPKHEYTKDAILQLGIFVDDKLVSRPLLVGFEYRIYALRAYVQLKAGQAIKIKVIESIAAWRCPMGLTGLLVLGPSHRPC